MTAPRPSDDWATREERSSLAALRLMRTVAMTFGRSLTRWLLPPITLYFVLGDSRSRRHSTRYLKRALGREPSWRDIYRHFHAFASTVLDRVYFLQERFDQFAIHATGIECILEPFRRGEGALLFGAHVGSFEALRAIGEEHRLNVAMVMYEDNARLINDTLAALAPKAHLHTIPLGRIDAMLALREWLDDGGVAGLLADRTLPGPAAGRSRAIRQPFLGQPAVFADGPFRLAAMLRRKVVFMAGLYRGGRQYELRFVEIADFGAPGLDRDAAVREGLARYVATLEQLCRDAPYNWFNFFDFWSDDAVTPDASIDPSTTTRTSP